MSNDTQPEIRFPGFTEDWEERRLQEVVDRYDNLRIPITASKRVAGNTPYYGANGIQGYVEGYTHDGEFILVAEDGANDLKNYPVQYVDGKVWVNNHAHVIQAKENLADNMFLMNAIRSINIEPFLVGGGRAKLNADVLMKLEVIIPLKSEQQKIGAFFKQLDDTIALHQRKLDLLKETKKGFLQKMFPKNGAKVPEIRFPGFTEDWEQRKLGDVTAEVFQGINTAGDKVEYSDTGTPILQAKHITGGDVTFDEARFLDKERYSNYFPKYVPVENDILFANIGTIGPSTVVRDESEFLVAWNILKITLKKPEIAEFIQLQLDQLNQKHYFDSVLTGNATKFVNKDEMLRTPISVPTIEEQKKVGVFFSNIQRAITLHQRKLDLLKETKKGFLQKMFV